MSGLALLGSCVTRDAFLRSDDTTVFRTVVCRSGFASLMAPPIANFVSPPVLGPLRPGGFAERALRMELDKTGLDAIERQRPNVLFVDFMDDRFALRLVGGSVLTESDEFWKSGLAEQEPFAHGRSVPRMAEKAWALWADGLARFRDRVLAGPLRDSRIVLHRAYLAARWRDGRPESRAIVAEMRTVASRATVMGINARFKRMHDAFEAAFPDAEVLEVDPAVRVADPDHRWGPGPYHYIPAYYEALRDAVSAAGIRVEGL